MEKYDWNDITGRLTRLLRPQTTPVGMKWVRTEEDLRAIPKVRIHDKHLPPCTIVSHAAQFNWTSACRAENVHANYCRGINGMFAPTRSGTPARCSRTCGTTTWMPPRPTTGLWTVCRRSMWPW